MIPPHLPAALKAALDDAAEGLSRKAAAQRASAISKTYRDGGDSATIRTADDALAYALTRMPATYAAVTASLNALTEIAPSFAPRSLLDVGAGPSTATWAAMEAFTSLEAFHLVDANPQLRDLALNLMHANSRLSAMRYDLADLRKQVMDASPADFVIASYVINELNETDRATLVATLWAKTRGVLLLIEPGTPAGYARIVTSRAELIDAGAHVLAPCPHDNPCPLTAPDWCHFTQRLQRSRMHKQLKGADVPFEDEKFSYVALTRDVATSRPARVLAQPLVSKIAVTAKLCRTQGIRSVAIPHRDKEAYKRAKKWAWGDAVTEPPLQT